MINAKNTKTNTLTVYIFDIDDNILFSETCINGFNTTTKGVSLDTTTIKNSVELEQAVSNGLLEPYRFSTTEFVEARNSNKCYFDYSEAFSDFRDDGVRGTYAFESDIRLSIKKGNFAPSWGDFKEALRTNSLFSLCTARGHEPETLKTLARMVIYNDDINNNGLSGSEFIVLVDSLKKFHSGTDTEIIEKYLADCEFCGVSSQYFADEFLGGVRVNATDPSVYKEIAIKSYFLRVNKIAKKYNLDIEVGFSDDDKENLDKVSKLFKILKSEHKEVFFTTYDTSKGTKKLIKKELIS